MSIEITGVTIAHRKKTAAEWADSEYVLAEAEWGYETDTGKAKIGDGVAPWGSLDYFGGDVDLSNYYTKSETDSSLNTKVTKPVGFDESTGDEYKYISGKGTLKDASALQKIGDMPDVVFSTENVTVGGFPIGYDALLGLDKAKWGFGIVTDLANTIVENSMIVLAVEDTTYRLANTVYIPSEGGSQALSAFTANRKSGGGNHYNSTYSWAYGYNSNDRAGIYATCSWDPVTKEEISREVYVEGETFEWRKDSEGNNHSTIARTTYHPPASSSSFGKVGQFAADADFLYYCYAVDSWATVPKDADSDGKAYVRKDGEWVEAVDNTLPINWLTVSTPTFKIEPEHAGMSLWVTVDCVITVSVWSQLPNGFNCEIFKADSSLIVSVVVATGGDTIRDGKSVIVSDASLFKTPSVGVFGLVGDVS